VEFVVIPVKKMLMFIVVKNVSKDLMMVMKYVANRMGVLIQNIGTKNVTQKHKRSGRRTMNRTEQIRDCKHEYENDIDAGKYCKKCFASPSLIKKIKEQYKNKTLGAFLK